MSFKNSIKYFLILFSICFSQLKVSAMTLTDYISQYNPQDAPIIADAIYKTSNKYDLDPLFVASVFNIESNLEGYLYRSLHNTCLNHLYNEQRKQEKLLHMPIEKDSSPTLTTELEDKEREYNQLYQALHKLPEQCKQVFTLCCLQNMKYQEAADYLGISINTVRTQMGRAYKILRNSLDSKSFLNLLFLRFLK